MVKLYKEGSIHQPILIDIDYCCICEEREPDFIGPNCTHIAKCCKKCIATWFKQSFNCPYCRKHLIPTIELQVPYSRKVLGIKVPAHCKLPDCINSIPGVESKKKKIRKTVKEYLWLLKQRAEFECSQFDNQLDEI